MRPRAARLVLTAALSAGLPHCAASGVAVPDPAKWQESRAAYQDLSLHVRVAGSGDPTIVLVHGLAGSSRYFGRAYDALAEHARVVVPDLLGFGASRRPEIEYDADQHARALIQVLDELRVTGPVYVVGYSAGSLVALRVASLRPEQVRGILAFGAPLYASPERARAHLSGFGWMARLFFLNRWFSHLACLAMCTFKVPAAHLARWLRPDLPAPIARDAVEHSWRSYDGTLRRLVVAPQPPPDLAELRPPLWLIAGEADGVVDFAFARELARQGRASFEVWPGGHDLPLTAPDRCIAAIRRLVAAGGAE